MTIGELLRARGEIDKLEKLHQRQITEDAKEKKRRRRGKMAKRYMRYEEIPAYGVFKPYGTLGNHNGLVLSGGGGRPN